jgi:hypothetical protein
MPVLEIRPAQREGARLVIGLAGVSGSGKTFTAIELAYGLADYDPAKVGFIDTENRRGSLYADILQHSKPPTRTPFTIGNLVAPFSPQRYIDAINEFAKTGIEVLVIDSLTHEHEGPGGLIDIAGEQNKFWNRAKAEHKKFMNALLQCDMHVIVCVRAREKASPEKNADGKTVYRDEGLQAVTEKNVLFEMSASLMMHDEGRSQTVLKCPAALAAVLGRKDGYITAADGKCIRDWVDGAKQLDPTVEKFRNRLLSVSEKGAAYVTDAWAKCPATVQTALGEKFRDTLLASAAAYDAQRIHAAEAEAGLPEQTPATAAVAAAASAGRQTRPDTPTPPAAAAPAVKADPPVTVTVITPPPAPKTAPIDRPPSPPTLRTPITDPLF